VSDYSGLAPDGAAEQWPGRARIALVAAVAIGTLTVIALAWLLSLGLGDLF
jgi:hypothetical protein